MVRVMEKEYKVLVAGDFHIPFRAKRIPAQLLTFIRDNEIDMVAITGDLVEEHVLKPFKQFTLKVVRGNMDIGNAEKFPEKEIISLPGLSYRILLYHGSGIYPRGDLKKLYSLTKSNQCKVLFTGHTHDPLSEKINDVVIINPGSGTGAYGGYGGFGKPTWAYITMKQSRIDVALFVIETNKVNILSRRSFDI